MSDASRLDRLFRAIGEDGFRKLNSSIVSIIFDDSIGKYFALPFVSSKMPVRLISTSKRERGERLIDILVEEPRRAHGYVRAFQKYYSDAGMVVGIEGRLGAFFSNTLLEGSKVIIDCTNNERSKQCALEYAKEKGATFISASVVPGYGKFAVIYPNTGDHDSSILMPGMRTLEEKVWDETRRKPDQRRGAKITKELVAAFIAGLAADEAVRCILEKDKPLEETVYFKFGYGRDMFRPKTKEDVLIYINPRFFRKKSAHVFGAGAVGTNVSFWLSKMGFGKIAFLDYDEVESTNVMRTLFYHDRIGYAKDCAAAEKIALISNGRTETKAFHTKLTPEWKPDIPYDVYIDGFDNFYSRGIAHNIALQNNMYLVSASGRFDGFDVEVYIPGQTLCFDCIFRINELAAKDEARQRQSCSREFTPQNTWINQSVGALTAMMAASALKPKKYGVPVNGMVFYDTNQTRRLFVNEKEGVCREGTHNVR